MMTRYQTTNDAQILAAALSSILGKEILPESTITLNSRQYVSKVSLFDQHLTSFVYGKVGKDESTTHKSLITLQISVLSSKTIFPCLIERDALVDQLKHFIYEREGILCNKQNLIFCGQEIDEGHRLSEYDIEDGSVINLVRLRSNPDDLLILDPSSWHQAYDYDFTNVDDKGKQFFRGSVEYRRPCGSKRYAIKVAGKYEDDVWLGSSNSPGEWPVSYHGTGRNGAETIAQTGYSLTKHSRFAHGRGVYSTPDINVAKGFAKAFDVNGQSYLVVLQNRVNPKNLIKLQNDITGNGEYWISPTDKDVRPYGLCIMKT